MRSRARPHAGDDATAVGDPHAAPAPEGLSVTMLSLVTLGLIVALVLIGQAFNPPRADVRPAALSVTLIAAFLGGLLAILSPCSGAILPAFFAYSFEGGALVRKTYLFFLGLALVFVPLGFASSFVFQLFFDHQSALVLGGGLLLVAFGAVRLFDIDLIGAFDHVFGTRLQPGSQGAAMRARSTDGRVFTMGLVFGFATSSCSAPIIGAIVTIAAGTGLATFHAMLLFLVFAFGIAFPLFLLALFFERYRIAERAWFRGRAWTLRLGPAHYSFHSTGVVTGLILIALGIVFITTSATLELTELYDRWGATQVYEETNLWIQSHMALVPPWVALLMFVALVALIGWPLVRRIRGPQDPPNGPA